MARIEDVIDVDQDEDQLDGQEDNSQDEPHTDLPEHASGVSRQDLIDETMNEGVQEAVISELAEKDGEITIEDLRKLPGAEDLSDEQLKAEWDKAVAGQGKAGAAGEDGEEAGAVKLPFPLYDDKGNKIKDVSKLTLNDLFNGKVQISYQAMDKEQRKTFSDLVRVAQLGHHNETKIGTLLSERNAAYEQYKSAKGQNDSWAKDRQVWDAALTAYAQGNTKPMEAIAKAYQAELAKMPAASVPGMVSESDARAMAEANANGQTFFYETIVPRAIDLAKTYGADEKEVANTALWLIEKEPPEFLTKEKIQSILAFELPRVLEDHGYKTGGPGTTTPSPVQTGPDPKVAALEAQVKELSAAIAKQANSRTQAVREKTRKAPPAGGGTTPGAGDNMPSFKSREAMKDWLRS